MITENGFAYLLASQLRKNASYGPALERDLSSFLNTNPVCLTGREGEAFLTGIERIANSNAVAA